MRHHTTSITSKKYTMSVSVFSPDSARPLGCIIYVHGFKGFKDWGFVPYIGEFLSGRGFLAVTFNFSHNGIGDDPLEFTEMDKFAANTFSLEIAEVRAVIAACGSGKFGETGNIGLLGHSRGGGIALLTAAVAPEVKAVATWSAVCDFNRYSENLKRQWREAGFIEVANKRTAQIMRLNETLLDDVENNGQTSLNIKKAVSGLNRPLLIIHGDADEAVPTADAENLAVWAGSAQSQLKIVPGTGHTFGAKHPFEGSNDILDGVLESTANFFAKAL